MRKKKGFFEALVNRKIGSAEKEGSVFHLELICPEIKKIQPGQFVILKPLRKETLMPRPFSVFKVEDDVITLAIKKIGKNTALYSELETGDKVEISRPLGIPFPKKIREKNCIFVGGGIGYAALHMPAMMLKNKGKKITTLLGVKTKDEILNVSFISQGNLEIITEDKKEFGRVGLVTDLLREKLINDKGKSLVIACGPKLMLRKVAEMCKHYNNRCLVMVEELMACGVGSCKGCAIFGKDGIVKHVCEDGPTFFAGWIDWEKFVPIQKLPKIKSDSKTRSMFMIFENENDLSLPLAFPFPIMNASGCLDLKAVESGHVDTAYAGALVTKGIELELSLGNVMPRTCETENGMINSIGLENPGTMKFISKYSVRWDNVCTNGKKLIINISGKTHDDYVESARRLYNEASVFELNISCPNVDCGGMAFGVSPEMTYKVVRAVRDILPGKFLFVKLSPNVTDIAVIAKAAIDAGADGISLINTLLGMSIDVWNARLRIGRGVGGYSGPSIKPVAVKMVRQVRQAFPEIPIIGMGGISNAEDAAEFMMAGADMIAVGTALFSSPSVMTEIYFGLKKIMKHHNLKHVSDFKKLIF